MDSGAADDAVELGAVRRSASTPVPANPANPDLVELQREIQARRTTTGSRPAQQPMPNPWGIPQQAAGNGNGYGSATPWGAGDSWGAGVLRGSRGGGSSRDLVSGSLEEIELSGNESYRRGTSVDRKRCLATVCAPLLVLLLSATYYSMATVQPTEYGLSYNHVLKTINRDTVHGGRHFIGLWNRMVKFPATVQTIEYSTRRGTAGDPLKTRTREGFDLTLQMAVQYQLVEKQIPDLYSNFLDDYARIFQKRIHGAILRVASTFGAYDYWLNRENITIQLKAAIDKKLETTYARCISVQLLAIALPTIFEQKIVTTQVEKQVVLTRQFQRQASLIRAITMVNIQEYQRNITVTLNGAYAEANKTVKTAQAEAEKDTIDVERTAMDKVYDSLALSAMGLVEYQRGLAFQGLSASDFLFGVPNAVAVTSGMLSGSALSSSVLPSSGLSLTTSADVASLKEVGEGASACKVREQVGDTLMCTSVGLSAYPVLAKQEAKEEAEDNAQKGELDAQRDQRMKDVLPAMVQQAINQVSSSKAAAVAFAAGGAAAMEQRGTLGGA